MSADNWAICPQCEKNAPRDESLYGKVDEQIYLAKLNEPTEKVDLYTLREDYEIGIDEDVFFANYRGRCTKCGFEFEFKETRKVKLQ